MIRKLTMLFLVVTLTLHSVDAMAQRDNVVSLKAVEVELGVGLATAANRLPAYGKSRQGVDANIELRYNFESQPVDLGLYTSVCSIYRVGRSGNFVSMHNFVSKNLLVTSDYNFCKGHGVSPFAGLGVGLAWSNINADSSPHGTHLAIMPRVGVELSNKLRITVAYKLFDRANNHLTFSLGYLFGGGAR